MKLSHLSHRQPLDAYEQQAVDLLDAFRAGDDDAVRLVWHQHPRFLDTEYTWKPRDIAESEVRSADLSLADAQLAIARAYDFLDWQRLAEFVGVASDPRSNVARFESAVDAVVSGDLPTLTALLRTSPDLVRARSTRVTAHDPPEHRATLLHYISANGVEGYRQRTPPNAADVARLLLETGAAPNAPAGFYGSNDARTMYLLVSSTPPAEAGVQVALVDVLADFGADVNADADDPTRSPLITAIVFGFPAAAEALIRRGARIDRLAAAAGLGRVDDARRLLDVAGPGERHLALALAAQSGHADVVGLLLDAGEDPNRFNPKGTHAHSMPIHQAALAGHDAVVRLLVERGARTDVEDLIYHGTPLGWAEHGGQTKVVEYLSQRRR
jgi:ankyrin repeat protein